MTCTVKIKQYLINWKYSISLITFQNTVSFLSVARIVFQQHFLFGLWHLILQIVICYSLEYIPNSISLSIFYYICMLLCPVIDVFGSTLSFLMEAAILENGRHFRKCSPNVMFCTICTCHRCILSILSEKIL